MLLFESGGSRNFLKGTGVVLLSKGVFERRTATGNETFPLFTRLGATTFVILSVVTRDDLLEN